MIIENTLDLGLAPDDAWRTLLNIPYVAPCLPGTKLTAVVDEHTYEGMVELKLGPVSLSFRGTAVIEDVDPEAMKVRVAAKGREDRGRGSAHATVTFQLHPTASGTRVELVTDLNLAGSIIQYARGAGMVTKTAQQLVDQFAARLSKRIDSGEEPDPEAIKVGSLLWQGLTARFKAGKPDTPDA